MTAQPHDLTELQLAWCREKLSCFATHHNAVMRRGAEVAKNRARFAKPDEAAEKQTQVSAQATAAAPGEGKS